MLSGGLPANREKDTMPFLAKSSPPGGRGHEEQGQNVEGVV